MSNDLFWVFIVYSEECFVFIFEIYYYETIVKFLKNNQRKLQQYYFLNIQFVIKYFVVI